jgi:hypothetical protein
MGLQYTVISQDDHSMTLKYASIVVILFFEACLNILFALNLWMCNPQVWHHRDVYNCD